MKPNLSYFKTEDFYTALQLFFQNLNIPINYLSEEPVRPRDILEGTYKKDHDAFEMMDDVYFLGMVDDAAFEGAKSLSPRKIESDYDGILIFGVTLHSRGNGLLPTRTHLAEISRAFNREYKYTPVVVVFRYDHHIAFASTERLKYKQEWREGEKAGKVSLLRDIDIDSPHRGHWDILSSLAIRRSGKKAVTTFEALYAYWQKVFSVSLLNKKFYGELSNWYFWALKEVYFPGTSSEADRNDLFKKEEKVKEHNAKNLIRLLTRLLFVWFIKEKDLIPEQLFDKDYIKEKLLKEFQPQKKVKLERHDKKSRYYRAILQNLFFATLNQKMGKREFRKKNYQHMNITNLMRYEDYFKDPELFVALVEEKVPFMNGGLFECLDQPDPEKKGIRGGDVIIYQDGFSDRKDNRLTVPDYIFFGMQEHVDLSCEYGSKKKTYKNAPVKGLINILNSYKFTITENTPIEEDVALDPELLGKVFENLLASYNPETKTTARKQTGSFYTPREIVNYMVNESLIAYLKTAVKDWGAPEEEVDVQLHQLLSYDVSVPFADNEDVKKQIIKAVDSCKILDPACGSGAFPMGILQKMVHILQKLDPDNTHWKTIQRKKATREAESAFRIEDKNAREEKLKEINNAFDTRINNPDYARKLFLIENCIYGVDIQSIAAQISKLRFFISLVVEQKVDREKDNFGIRPLPNLETKFVAANTLIGVEKPEHSKALFDSPEIEKLEKEIKSIRHKIFSVKSPTTKRKWRDRDKEVRIKMGKLLVHNGFGNKTAKQLVDWDPYDQNGSADFFDKEWMFGIEEGFDVIIGNPPYGVSIKGDYRKEILKYLLKVPDYEIYYFFIEAAKQCLSEYGILTYIVPNTYLFNVFAKKYRQHLLSYWNVQLLLDFTDYSLFESATVRNSVFVFNHHGKTNEIKFLPTTDKKLNLDQFIRQKLKTLHVSFLKNFSQNWALAFKLPESVTNALGEIKRNSKPLSLFYPKCSQGLIAYDKYRGQDSKTIKTRAYHFTEFSEGLKKWLWGEDVTKYQINWNGKEYIDYCEGIANPRKPEFFKSKRMLIREITNPSIFSAITKLELYNDPSIIIVLESEFPIEIASIILNSTFGTFYHFNTSPKATKGEFPKILVKDIKDFPITKNIAKINADFVKLIYELASFSISSKFYRDVLNKVIDGIVFEFYFPEHMKEKKINILKFVQNDLGNAFKNKKFDGIPNNAKENLVEFLYEKWTHPDSEVRNRIKLFAVRSPDILKPILESK